MNHSRIVSGLFPDRQTVCSATLVFSPVFRAWKHPFGNLRLATIFKEPMATREFSSTAQRFDGFEVDPRARELRRNGLRIRIQDQPLEVLLLLLERNGEVVTREELKQRLWPAGTYVDSEDGLNTAVRKLREHLSDSVERPVYIETIPRRGYRFIGKLESLSDQHAYSSDRSQSDQPSDDSKRPTEVSTRRKWLVFGALLSAFLLLSGLWLFLRNPIPRSLAPMEIVPIVSFEGEASHPALSPDGHQIAFAMHSKNNSGIYVSSLSGGKTLKLTSGSDVGYPRWSPDGQEIAFLRVSKDVFVLNVLPVLGGIERRLYSGPATQFSLAFDWSPDGNSLAISQSDPDKIHARISLISRDGSRITTIDISFTTGHRYFTRIFSR